MNAEDVDLKELKKKIDQIEVLARELQQAGAGIPVIEKNARSILSFVNVLKFGVSDPAELSDKK